MCTQEGEKPISLKPTAAQNLPSAECNAPPTLGLKTVRLVTVCVDPTFPAELAVVAAVARDRADTGLVPHCWVGHRELQSHLPNLRSVGLFVGLRSRSGRRSSQ